MPYVMFITVNDQRIVTKAKVQFTDRHGQTDGVLSVPEPEFQSAERIVTLLLAAITDHIDVRKFLSEPQPPAQTA